MANTAQPKKKTKSQLTKAEGGNLIPFTKENARAAQLASQRAKALRSVVRAQILDDAIKGGIGKLLIKAMKSGDLDQMTLAEKAMKLVGLDYASGMETRGVRVSASSDKPEADSDQKALTVEFEVVDGRTQD